MNHSDISFSVIVPTHDRPEGLANALKSLQAQTHRNFEVVVVNDGDSDIAEVVEHSGLEQVSIVRTSGHTGPSAARNAGLEAAKGDVIAYLDDDDLYGPDHLMVHARQYAADPKTAVVYSDAERCVSMAADDGSSVLDVEVIHSKDFDPDALLIYNYIPILCLSHRRACLDKTGGFEPTLFYLEDWDLFIRLAWHWEFVHVKEVTARYFETKTGASVQEKHRDNFISSLNTVYNRAQSTLEKDSKRLAKIQAMRLKHVGRMLFDTARQLQADGQLEEAAEALAKAMEHDPTAEGYLTLAQLQKQLGLKREALISMQLAQQVQELKQGDS